MAREVSPPAGWQNEDYRLTTASYTGLIMRVARALGLERPVVMGCSIGGRIVLELALKHARELRALIGLQSGAYVERYYDAVMARPSRGARRPRLRRGRLRAHVAAQP